MDVIRFEQPQRDRRRSDIACLDSLRAFAALAVVMLHAGVPYLHHRMPGLVWPVDDVGSVWVDALFWSIELMIMPLFLVIAGFLLWRSSHRSRPERLIRSRAKRLLIPFGFGLLVVLPADLYIWTLGLVTEGVVPPVKLKSFKFEPHLADQLWGTSHLWFLLYVFLYVCVAAVVLKLAAAERWPSWMQRLRDPKVLAGVLFALACGTLAFRPEIVWGFQHAFLPVPSKWIYSGAFFAAGCVLAAHDGQLRWPQANSRTLLSLATVLMLAAWAMGVWYLARSENALPVGRAAMVCLSLLTVGAATTTTFGLIGAGQRMLSATPPVIGYLAAASFWVYLIHHPLLGLIHIDLKWLWPQGTPVLKMLVSFAVATTLSLVTYEWWVRRSRLGVWLGMAYSTSKSPREPIGADVAKDSPAPTQQPERRAA